MPFMKKNVEGIVRNDKENVVTVEEDENEEKADDDVMCISDGTTENVFNFNMRDFNNDFKTPGVKL